MNSELRLEIANLIKELLKITKEEDLNSARKFYEKNLRELLSVKIKEIDPEFYNKNFPYFIEINEMLYVHPFFTKPFRYKEDSIKLIQEFLEEIISNPTPLSAS